MVAEHATALLDRFEYAAMAYGRLNKMTRYDEKTRALRKETIANLAAARKALQAALSKAAE